MSEVLPVLAMLALAAVLGNVSLRSFPRRERGLLFAALAAHCFASFAQVWITEGLYGGGDMMLYHRSGSALARLMRHNPTEFVPEIIKLIFRGEPRIPIGVQGIGGATASMSGISGLLALGLNDSLYAMCLALSIAAFFGELAIYRVFRERFAKRYHRRLIVGVMLLPSTVYWTSALLKETVAVAGLGWAFFGAHRLFQRRFNSGIPAFFIGALGIGFVKPYVFLPLALGLAVWWYWRRAQRRSGGLQIRPIHMVLGAVAVVGLMLLVGSVFPRYALDNLSHETARLQTVGTRITGGSNYSLMVAPEGGLAVQALYAPLALMTSLFRPFVFEATGAAALVNAIETTVVSFFLLRALWQLAVRRTWNIASANPILMFAIVFVLTFGVAVGLASTNLGSLSRYRVPLMPFYLVLVVLLDAARAQRKARAKAVKRPAASTLSVARDER